MSKSTQWRRKSKFKTFLGKIGADNVSGAQCIWLFFFRLVSSTNHTIVGFTMLARAALKDFERAAIDSVAAFYKDLPLLQRYVQTVKGLFCFLNARIHSYFVLY
jgi:hypothetical protein